MTHFQPIVNIKTRRTVGLEALIRGTIDHSDGLIPPYVLFREAEKKGFTLELDRAAREMALHEYRSIGCSEPPILFVNLNASILNSQTLGSNRFINSIVQESLDPSQVAIEVIESMTENPDHLIDFTRRHRKHGSLIVIDDFGAQHSNLIRLNDIRPDIIKIDRAIVSGLDRDPYKRSIVSSIADLAHMIGALCLTEGVETEAELAACHLLRADLFQGFYFSPPSADVGTLIRRCNKRIADSRPILETAAMHELQNNTAEYARIRSLVRELCARVAAPELDIGLAELAMTEFMRTNHDAACSYLLDHSGLQVSETIWRDDLPRRRLVQLFQRTPRGFDHSLKGYYLNLQSKDEFFSDPYLSLATGNRCRTMSTRLHFPAGEDCILCIDFEKAAEAASPPPASASA